MELTHMSRQTSISAYNGIIEDGTAQSQIMRIYSFLKTNRASRREISMKLNLEINAVCGRVNELIKSGKVRIVGVTQCPTTRKQTELLESSI